MNPISEVRLDADGRVINLPCDGCANCRNWYFDDAHSSVVIDCKGKLSWCWFTDGFVIIHKAHLITANDPYNLAPCPAFAPAPVPVTATVSKTRMDWSRFRAVREN